MYTFEEICALHRTINKLTDCINDNNDGVTREVIKITIAALREHLNEMEETYEKELEIVHERGEIV